MRVETQFSVFVVNKPGVLAAVTGALASAKVNMTALSLMDSGDHGMLRMVCNDPEKARSVLSTAHDRWTETPVLVLELGNAPGAFAAASKTLADKNINVTYAYCTAIASDAKAAAVFKVDDPAKAMSILEQG
ncbi:MAG: ACT domain-containing protein [Phycisphaerae bacterium]|jgi:hypothetical protein